MNALVLGLAMAFSTEAAGRHEASGIARPLDRWAVYIKEASVRFAIPEEWIRQVIRAESGGRTMLRGRPITSHAGAMGLMQLMPGTWAQMRSAHGLGTDPHDPRDNIIAGTAYLRLMFDRFGHPGLFAAYNAGPARYAEHLSRGRPLPAETIAYVGAVGGAGPAVVGTLTASAPSGSLFFALTSISPEKSEGKPTGRDGIFIRLSRDPIAAE